MAEQGDESLSQVLNSAISWPLCRPKECTAMNDDNTKDVST